MIMSFQMKLVSIILLFLTLIAFSASSDNSSSAFTFSGFKSANLTLDGLAQITPNGLLKLSADKQTGHAFYPTPFLFKNSSSNNASAFSFSTYFIFAILRQFQPLSGQGMTFVLTPTRKLPASPLNKNSYLGLFNESNNGNVSNHIVAVELDTFVNDRFNETNDNHVGIDINGLVSELAKPAAYHNESGLSQNLTLNSGKPIQVWIEYDHVSKLTNVTLAPLKVAKPSVPLLSLRYDLSTVINEVMYVGFSGAPFYTSHYVLGWSFSINGGAAQPLDLSQLPKLPRIGPKKKSKFLTFGLPVICVVLPLIGIVGIAYYVRRTRKFAEVFEEWELGYKPHRFSYKDLYIATKGFKDKGLLGTGGFGKVFKGVMPSTKIEVAVKKVSHDSRQGMKEFVAEIVSIGRLRHRNLVRLLGYSRRKGELLLVYEYMPNGSLDKFLHDNPKFPLNWERRFRVIKGVASGILYLHEEWEQVVIHRDIKASNILLDGELKARVGDFGLARLYDHGSESQTTHVVGTLGYLAPEHTRTGRATTQTDVYAFGAFLLEVACGRRPVNPNASCEKRVLVEWVHSLWRDGKILGAVDPNLGSDYDKEEVKLVLELGLLCSHSRPEIRPGMREIVRYLEGVVALPELSKVGVSAASGAFGYCEGFDEFCNSYPSSSMGQTMFTGSSSVSNSLMFSGR